MPAQIFVGILTLQTLRSWFLKHDEEAASVCERFFERPDEPGKVRFLPPLEHLVQHCLAISVWHEEVQQLTGELPNATIWIWLSSTSGLSHTADSSIIRLQ